MEETKQEKTLLKIQEILQGVFPDKWDYQPQFNTSKELYYHVFVLHFPEVLTTNSKNFQYLHKDIFIQIKFYPSFKLLGITGRRSTVNYTEYRKGYVHPHICTVSRDTYLNALHIESACCLGGGTELDTLTNELRLNFTQLRFETYLMLLDQWIHWESIEGGPYSKGTQGLYTSSYVILDLIENIGSILYKDFIRKFSTFPLGFKDTLDKNYYQVLLNQEFEQQCTSLVFEKHLIANYDKNYFQCVKEGQEYFSLQKVNKESMLKEYTEAEAHSKNFVTFKNQKFYLKVLPIQMDEQESQIVCHPGIQKYIAQQLEQIVNEEQEEFTEAF